MIRSLLPAEQMLEVSSTAGVSATPSSRAGVPTVYGSDEISARVLAAARRGEHKAFVAVLRHYDRRLRLLAYRLLRNRDQLDDALQELPSKPTGHYPSSAAKPLSAPGCTASPTTPVSTICGAHNRSRSCPQTNCPRPVTVLLPIPLS